MSSLAAAPGRSATRPTPTPSNVGTARPDLRPLATPGRRLARLPFLVVLIVAFGVGMAGLLMLNTTLQNQEFEARRLNRQATELTYVQDDLESQLSMVSAPAALAQKAYEAGMRPAVHPAFLVLPDGTVVGDAQTSKGTEMKYLTPGVGEQLTAERAAAAKAKRDAAAAKAAAATAAAPAPIVPPSLPAPTASKPTSTTR